MSLLSTSSAGSEAIFVELIQALNGPEDRLRVLEAFIRRFPEHETEIRDLANFHSALDDSPSVDPPPPVPKKLGEFQLVRLMKVGGMGEIYEAYHERLDRRVALKIVRRGWTTSFARERFAREQHVLAKLHHSNIVPIQTGGEDGPIQYFTMPFIQGSALNHVVDAVASISTSAASGPTPSVPEIVGRVLRGAAANSTEDALPLSQQQPKVNRELLAANQKISLSRSYFTSVARTMIDVADAVEYAHKAGVLHRDLKPANVMIESSGHCWVIDFGLAARLLSHETSSSVPRTGETIFGNTSSELGGGTYNYMAPERWQGKPADERSDIFSLGAMLYELIALRPAYNGTRSTEIKQQILQAKRVPAKSVVKHLPPDLADIADKAMHIEPGLRYQRAADFADDLKRWLRFEPIRARPTMPWKRLWLWTRRNPAIATALIISLGAAICLFAAIVKSYQNQIEMAEAANRVSKVRLERDRLHHALLGEHAVGWSTSAWENVRSLIREDSSIELKSLAAETRLGLDAQTTQFWEFPTSHLAYNSSGTRLLMVRYVPPNLAKEETRPVVRRAQVWDSVKHKLQELPETIQDGFGAVTFRNDEEPLQMVWNQQDANAILLWDLAKQVSVARLECPQALTEPPLSWSITPGGKIAGALIKQQNKLKLCVWETTTSQRLACLDTTASVIELSPDGELVATACANGLIEVWSVKQARVTASFSESHTDILCFAWTKDRLRANDLSSSDWLLAAGAYGGDLTIWDVARKNVRSRCIGSCFEVFSLAFSPDGTTLASAGRMYPMLWNVATGELLLRLGITNTMTSVVYSPNGDHLAIGASPAWGESGGVTEYEVQEMRGQQIMRGLRSRIAQVRFSANNRYVAGLSDNWQMAIWDLKRHRLLHVFQVPIGVYAETAGLAFDAEEKRIAFVAGREAKVWDIHSGALLKKVVLPPGFLDSLVFQDAETLLSARQESVDPEFPPDVANSRPDLNPRVCRVRNLLSTEPEKPMLTIADFKRGAAAVKITPSGKQLLIEGYYEGGPLPAHRLIKLFDLPSGAQRWEIRNEANGARNHRVRALDVLGRMILMAQSNIEGQYQVLIDLPTGVEIRQVPPTVAALTPDASLVVSNIQDVNVPGRTYLAVCHGEQNTQNMRLGLTKSLSDGIAISNDERYVIYGCSEGSVVVTDLWNVQGQLSALGFK